MAMQDVVVKEMKLQDLKVKTPTELLSFAEETGVENASAMRKQELMFAILKQLAAKETDIIGTGVVAHRSIAAARVVPIAVARSATAATTGAGATDSARIPSSWRFRAIGKAAHDPSSARATMIETSASKSSSRSARRGAPGVRPRTSQAPSNSAVSAIRTCRARRTRRSEPHPAAMAAARRGAPPIAPGMAFAPGAPLLAERKLDFEAEVSIISRARALDGSCAAFPIARNR